MSTISFKSVGKSAEDVLAEQLSQVRVPIGPVTPLRAGSGAQFFEMHDSLADQVRDNLRNLLLTNRGERLILTSYGADLRPLAAEFAGLQQFDAEAIQKIRDAVAAWMPLVELDTYASELRDDSVLITISYNVAALAVSGEQLQFQVNLA